MIKVGGENYINPKTGWYCDYAQAVHDGTRYMQARPFLTDAIAMCEPEYQMLVAKIDAALLTFSR